MGRLAVRQARHRSWIKRYFLHPVQGIIVVFFFQILRILPLKFALVLGASLGKTVGVFAYHRNKIAFKNLEFAFPEISLAEKKRIVRCMWANLGRTFASGMHLKELLKTAEFVNASDIKKVKDYQSGGFIFSAHIGNWEVISELAHVMGVKIACVYRPANNPWIERFIFKKRKGVLIPKGLHGSRILIQTLKDKHFVAMLSDQKLNEGIEAPFFNHDAKSPTAMAELMVKMNLPVLPCLSVWKNNSTLKIELFPPLKMPLTGDHQQKVYDITCQMNNIMQQWIRTYPEQWFWLHRRFDKKLYTDV